jgi:hypothetical protein
VTGSRRGNQVVEMFTLTQIMSSIESEHSLRSTTLVNALGGLVTAVVHTYLAHTSIDPSYEPLYQ